MKRGYTAYTCVFSINKDLTKSMPRESSSPVNFVLFGNTLKVRLSKISSHDGGYTGISGFGCSVCRLSVRSRCVVYRPLFSFYSCGTTYC